MKATPEFTDAEIHEMMDFSQVLALTEEARQRNKRIVRRIVTTVLVAGLVGGALFVYRMPSSESSAPSQLPASNVPPVEIPPTTVSPDTTRQPATPLLTDVPKNKPAQKPLNQEKKKLTEETKAAEAKKETKVPIRGDSAVSVFMPAEPIDGYPALYDYFATQLRYPEQAMKDSIRGVISVTFIINAQGKPEHVVTDHALGEAFEQEAIRLIENMPPWKPAQLDGSPVKSKLSVPITFTLKTIRQQ